MESKVNPNAKMIMLVVLSIVISEVILTLTHNPVPPILDHVLVGLLALLVDYDKVFTSAQSLQLPVGAFAPLQYISGSIAAPASAPVQVSSTVTSQTATTIQTADNSADENAGGTK